MAIGDRPSCSCCGDLDAIERIKHHNTACAKTGERAYPEPYRVTLVTPIRSDRVIVSPGRARSGIRVA